MNNLLLAFPLALAFTAISLADSLPIESPDRLHPVTITIIPTLGPRPSSPSYAAYVANVIHALETNLAPVGDQSLDPTAFNYNYNVTTQDFISTPYASWMGTADPTGALTQESGNYLYYAVKIDGGRGSFSLSDLSDVAYSTDASNYWSDNFSFAADTYRRDLVGFHGDTKIASGSSSQLVNKLFYIGVGFSFNGAHFTGATDQEKLDNAIAADNGISNGQPNSLHLTYSVKGYTGSSTVGDGPSTPEPGTMLPMGGGLIVFSAVARRIRRNQSGDPARQQKSSLL